MRSKGKPWTLPDDLYTFLNEADKLYIKAFETRSVKLLADYFTIDCIKTISQSIIYEGASRYFSEERFRETKWSVISKVEDVSAKVKKLCIYRAVRISPMRKMKISNDYAEEWTVSISEDEFWVTDIKEILGDDIYE